jgi:ABC-type Fe3+-hydroxamate transport system substrate-binding protein
MVCSGILTRGSSSFARVFPSKGQWRRAAPRIQWRDRAGISPVSRAQTCRLTFGAAGGPSWRQKGRRMRSRWFFVLVVSVLCACAGRVQSAPALGTTHARIVALAPSIADDLYAIGAGDNLVAVSAFTDDPRAKALPRVADASSIDAERIVTLHPDVAVGIRSQARQTQALQHAGVRIVLLDDDGYDTIFSNLRAIGSLCGRRTQADATVASLRRTTAELHARTHAFRRAPSVFVVLGNAPIWTAGNRSYVATLIALAGGTNAASDLPAAYAQYSSEALLRAQPDIVVADPMVHLDAALGSVPWSRLQAVRARRVYTVQPPDILMRPGPQYNQGIRWLIDRLKPIAS